MIIHALQTVLHLKKSFFIPYSLINTKMGHTHSWMTTFYVPSILYFNNNLKTFPYQIIPYGPTSRLYSVCSTLVFIHFSINNTCRKFINIQCTDTIWTCGRIAQGVHHLIGSLLALNYDFCD